MALSRVCADKGECELAAVESQTFATLHARLAGLGRLELDNTSPEASHSGQIRQNYSNA